MPFVVGETIGPYRILEQLGRGGMATVFKAYHASLDRYVAIKALHPAFMEDPNFHKRFQREARVVAKLEHPNIVPIYDFSEYENRPYLVMKYITGDTLKARLNTGVIGQDELLRIVKSVGAGLAYAHKQGILHRDIKPSNVLLAEDGRIYLADFGLARIAQAGESTLSSDVMLGTPQYISPEQAMGVSDLDERTDIYSFGVMLYEMTVGQVPFSADTPFSIIHDHIYTPLPLPRAINPDLPEGVERVLLKALSKEREDRYATVDALVAAFTQAITVQAEPAAAPARPAPVRAAAPPKVETPPETGAASVPPVESPPPAAPASPLASSPAKAKPPRRRRRWPIVLALVFVCLGGLLALGALSDQRGQDDLLSPEAAVSLPEATGQVGENPEDPTAWLALASAYWDDGRADEARAALIRALETAGDDEEFYLQIADSLMEAGAWADAAQVYLLDIRKFHSGKVPPPLKDVFHEAVYRAAEIPDFGKIVPLDELAEIDPALAKIADARSLLFAEQSDAAYDLAEQVLRENRPGMSEASLLMAEILLYWGDASSARDHLEALRASAGTPDWVQEYIDALVGEIQQALVDAQAAVDASPDDPWAHLDLFKAYLAAGQYDDAQAALEQALRLAEGDPAIQEQAGDVFASYGQWSRAAEYYIYAAQDDGHMLPSLDLTEKLLQAMYYAMPEDNAQTVLIKAREFWPQGDTERAALRTAHLDALTARYSLYHENPDDARIRIDEVAERASGLFLVRLIQGEIYLAVGEIEPGKAILTELRDTPRTPDWVRDEAQWLLEPDK